MKSYRDLEIYQLSYELAVKVHKFTLGLPKYEQYEEGSQVRKSSKGITSCIVEGYGRRKYKADFNEQARRKRQGIKPSSAAGGLNS